MMCYNTTFQAAEIFCFNYTKDSVVSRMKIELRYIKSLSVRYVYLKSAWEFIRTIKPNEHLDLIFSSVLTLDYDRQRMDRTTAYYLILDWIDEAFEKVETEVKNAKKKVDLEKQIKDAQKSFKIKKEYAHLLLNMWELMKDRKNYLIHPDTLFEDFKIIFEHKKAEEIKNPIVWVGNKITLVKLFCTLSDKNIIKTFKLVGERRNSFDISFLDCKTKKPYPQWRDTHIKAFAKPISEDHKIDKILALFQ
jgi:hypothetical protein